MSKVTGANRAGWKTWLPVFLWAGLIFLFSSESFSSDNTASALAPWLHWAFPGWSTDAVELVNYLFRKLGHLSEYFVFALLVMRALRARAKGALSRRQIIHGLVITAAYAISDELHQALVPGRSAAVSDVLIDICGGFVGAAYFNFTTSRNEATGVN